MYAILYENDHAGNNYLQLHRVALRLLFYLAEFNDVLAIVSHDPNRTSVLVRGRRRRSRERLSWFVDRLCRVSRRIKEFDSWFPSYLPTRSVDIFLFSGMYYNSYNVNTYEQQLI